MPLPRCYQSLTMTNYCLNTVFAELAGVEDFAAEGRLHCEDPTQRHVRHKPVGALADELGEYLLCIYLF